MKKIIEQNNKYNLVFEQNQAINMDGIYIIETRKNNNMIYNFIEESEAIKKFNEIKSNNK